VFARAGLFFGLLFGAIGGGLTASVLAALFRAYDIRLLPPGELIPLMIAGTGAVFGALFAYADYRITRATPEDRLDPIGAVRQRVTLEVPLDPERALEAASRIVFEDLEWAIEDRAEGSLLLRVPASFRSFGEQVSVDLHPTPGGSAVLLFSRPLSRVILIDYNKNRENVLRLRDALLSARAEPSPARKPRERDDD
jgi:hypothetical protein